MKRARATFANPVDSICGAPICVKYGREFSKSKRKLLKELIISCAYCYVYRTTRRVNFVGMSITAPSAFCEAVMLNDIVKTAKEKYNLCVDRDALEESIPSVVVNGTCLASRKDIFDFGEAVAWDFNGNPKHSSEEAFKIVFGGRKMEV